MKEGAHDSKDTDSQELYYNPCPLALGGDLPGRDRATLNPPQYLSLFHFCPVAHLCEGPVEAMKIAPRWALN